MKRLIFIGVALALVVGLIWVPAVAAVSADIIIHKTIDPDCPDDETFHFEAWRDLNPNGIIDAGDTLQGTVDITGAGTGVITVSIIGQYIIREVLEDGSAYEPHPDQPVFVACDEHVDFHNTCQVQLCELVILKTDEAGSLLPGSCFTITPDPWTGTDSVIVCDNDSNDKCPEDGLLCLTELICGLTVTVEETTPPPGGYEPGEPQTVVIGETVELTFVNTLPAPCRITGGGTIGKGRDPRVTHGFELHCNVDQVPNNLEVNWGGDHFHLLELTFVECSDDPAIDPKPPRVGCDTYHGIGVGRYNGVDGYLVHIAV